MVYLEMYREAYDTLIWRIYGFVNPLLMEAKSDRGKSPLEIHSTHAKQQKEASSGNESLDRKNLIKQWRGVAVSAVQLMAIKPAICMSLLDNIFELPLDIVVNLESLTVVRLELRSRLSRASRADVLF